MNILVTVDKFGSDARSILDCICLGKHSVYYNNNGRKLNSQELLELISITSPEIIIAGTEAYDKGVLDECKNLKVISRVGIGLDSIDLKECESRNIVVENTPDAPTNAVAELTIAQIFNTIRRVQEVDRSIRDKNWFRYVGKDLNRCTVGIIGYGRIGSKVCKLLSNMCSSIYVNEIDESIQVQQPAVRASLNSIIEKCDIISIHVPLTSATKNLISIREFNKVKDDCVIINTSRGGIINENHLYDWLSKNKNARAAIDVFEQEPYVGKLTELNNCYLTAHLGSCTIKSRLDMEIGSVENIKKYL